MTAPFFGAMTVFLVALLVWVYVQVREAYHILTEVAAVEGQSQRELQRARRLLGQLIERSPQTLPSEHFDDAERPNVMSRQSILTLGEKLAAQPDSPSLEIRGLTTDIRATLDRLNSLQQIESKWRERLSIRTQRPGLRFLLKLNGFER